MKKKQFKKKSIVNTSFAIFTCLCLLITSFFNIKPIKAAEGYDRFSATLTFKLEDPENLIEEIANSIGRDKRNRDTYKRALNSIVRNGLVFTQYNEFFQEEINSKKFLGNNFIGANLDYINQPESYGQESTEHFDFLKGLRTDNSTNTISVLNNIRDNIKTRLEIVKDKLTEGLKNRNTKVFNNVNLNKLILHDKDKDYKELKQDKAASSPTNKRIRLVLDKPLEFVKDPNNLAHKNNIDFNLEFTEELLTGKGIPLTLTTYPLQTGKFDDSNFDFAAFVAFATLFQDDQYDRQAAGNQDNINAGMVLPISIKEVKIPVSVEYISNDPNIVIPEELKEKRPLIEDQSVNQTINGAKEGESITTKNGEENFSETVTLNDGSQWKFKGYLKDNDKNNLTDTNIDKDHSITTIYNDDNDEKLNKLIGVWELLTPPTPSVPSTVDVTVEKIWSKGPSTHPSITLNLLQDGEPYMKEGAKVTITLDNDKTTYTWNDLPKSNDDGTDYTYTVREEAVENYSAEYQDSSEDVNGKKTFKTVITNTYTSPNIEISLTKNWVNGPNEKPTAVFVLYKNGVASNDHTAVLEKGASTHTFTVPKTDEDGNLIDYSIREVAIIAEGELANSYRSSVSGNVNDGYVVTNTYVSPKVDITVSKQWENGDNVRPLSVNVQLKRNGANYKDPVTLNAENNWQHT